MRAGCGQSGRAIGGAEAGFSLVALLEDVTNEANGISLGFRVGSSVKKFGNPPRADRIEIKEIGAQVIQCLCGAGVREQRTQLRRHVRNSPTVVPKQIEKVVGILVFTANPEGKRLENDERARSADADVSGGGLPEDGLAAQGACLPDSR